MATTMAASRAATAGSDEFRDLIYESVYYASQKMGVSPVVADDLARMVERDLRNRRGGDKIYVPAAGTAERDRNLLADRLMGFSVADLQARYNLSRSQVYTIISRLKSD